jgi:fatty acid-binding protein DegV
LALKEMIAEKVKFNEVFIQYVGPVIGTHAGPDTLAVCFLGKPRGE